MDCVKCGEPMRMTEKDTSSGRDIREYKCDRCGHEDWEVRGPALWQLLSDDREEYEAAKAAREAAASEAQPEPPQSTANAPISLRGRFLAWLAGSHEKD
jgi:DNA-directed RNA polymerase subunit M/transcription elongation factor TFIIS